MLLGGLWHGANWTFVVWGALHGTALALERYVRQAGYLSRVLRLKIDWSWPRRIFIFHLVCLGWVFFRADSLKAAVIFLRGLGHFAWEPGYFAAFKFLALFSAPLFLLDLYLDRTGQEYFLQERTPLMRVAVACSALVLIAFFSANQANAFIYFQF